MAFFKSVAAMFIVGVTAASPVPVKRVADKMQASDASFEEAGGVRRVARVRRAIEKNEKPGEGKQPSGAVIGATGQVLKENTLSLTATCADTQGWTNAHGKTCEQYASEGWCNNHRVHERYDFWAGFNYNHPENNCCACGKGCSDAVRSTFHSVLCRGPSLMECMNLTAQSLAQKTLEESVRSGFAAVGTGCDEGIPACDGCMGRTNECHNACKDSAGNFAPGMCSKCDAVSGGKKGACCMNGRADDPPECRVVPSHYFKFHSYHECVLVDKAFPKSEGLSQGEYNPRECWSSCGSTGGYCSLCDSPSFLEGGSGVIRGACCKKGSTSDPTECQYAPTANFIYEAGHSCVLTEVPKCAGCGAKAGECWTACNGAPGYCSACDSAAGTRGACCRESATDDPAECRNHVGAGSFRFKAGYHECVLTNHTRTPELVATATAPKERTAEFDATLHSTGDVCETSSYISVPLVNGEPAAHQACNGWDMGHLTISAGEEQCWQHCLKNTIAPGCALIQTQACVASEYWTAYKWCHLHSSCDQTFHKQPGANTRMIVTQPPTPPPTTPAPTNEPASAVSAAVEVHTASTAKPKNVTCSGTVTSDAHCVSWYSSEPEPTWHCELFPDRPAAEVKFSVIEGSTSAVILHNGIGELKYYGEVNYWDWNTMQAICKTALVSHTPQPPR